jgi:acetoacetate decarboxylase
MPVDDDMAMAGGREVFGYPKKMAESITLETAGTKVFGSVVRKGTELIRIEVEPNRSADIDALAQTGEPDPTSPRAFEVTVYLFKHFQSPTMRGFDYLPRLVAEPVVLRPRDDVLDGNGALSLTSSPYDPVGEIPVIEMITCAYGTFDNTMLPGKVVGRVWNPLAFAKHALFKVDVVPVKLGYVDDHYATARENRNPET